MELTVDQVKRIVEASLLMNREPQTAKKLAELFTPEENITERAIIDTLTLLAEDYRGRGVELVEVATGYRFQVCADLAPWIQRTMAEKPQRYSRALLETLALIAYRQPITRAEIEEIRGVVVSTQIMRTLEEREWVRVIGHRDVPGRPALYATTKQFLNDLNLKSLGELPTLAELQDLDKLDGEFQQLNLDIAPQESNQPENPENLSELNTDTEKVANEQTHSELADENNAPNQQLADDTIDFEAESIEEEKEEFIQELINEEFSEEESSAETSEWESEEDDEELMNDENEQDSEYTPTHNGLTRYDDEDLDEKEIQLSEGESEDALSEHNGHKGYSAEDLDNEEEDNLSLTDDDEELLDEEEDAMRDSDSFDEDHEELEEENELNFESEDQNDVKESYFEDEEEEYEELELNETEA